MHEIGQQTAKGGLVVCRELTEADREQAIALLTTGFKSQRSRAFWERALDRLARREVAAGLPRFGYVLELDDALVGLLLLIVSSVVQDGVPVLRCNVSSWYLLEGFRPFGSLLVSRALRHREFVTINVTPAPETWALLAAQGYVRYADGRAVAFPVLAAGRSRIRFRRFVPGGGDGLPEHERRLVRDHHEWGCLALIGETASGSVPFVFGLRRRRGVRFAYLLYARSAAALVEHARPLGWFLLRYGALFVVADGNARLAGMPGWFERGFPKFVRGSPAPMPGDLAYTERAVFGV